MPERMISERTIDADVLIVGAGPGGATAAYHLARHGIDVLMLDRSSFPREKVCGDGLTPRAVAALLKMGIDTADPGFERVEGLRVHTRHCSIDLAWPELETWPNYGLVRTRYDFDQLLVQRAQKAGARLNERTEAVEPLMEDGWVRGAVVRPAGEKEAALVTVRARVLVAADGAAGRFAARAGVRRDPTRPLGIAARRYYETDYLPGPWLESWLDLWNGESLLPGYGWLFPVEGGRLNLGAGLLNTFQGFKDISAQLLFDDFVKMLPAEYGISEETAAGRTLSGPLPMSFNRSPLAVPGLLVVGDAAGAINPFNGEGIAYAMETAEMAAELVHEGLVKDRPGIVAMYPTLLRQRYGRYFSIGRGFVKLIGKPAIMSRATKHLVPNRRVMNFAMRVLANLSDGKDGNFQDRLMYLVERFARAA